MPDLAGPETLRAQKPRSLYQVQNAIRARNTAAVPRKRMFFIGSSTSSPKAATLFRLGARTRTAAGRSKRRMQLSPRPR